METTKVLFPIILCGIFQSIKNLKTYFQLQKGISLANFLNKFFPGTVECHRELSHPTTHPQQLLIMDQLRRAECLNNLLNRKHIDEVDSRFCAFFWFLFANPCRLNCVCGRLMEESNCLVTTCNVFY